MHQIGPKRQLLQTLGGLESLPDHTEKDRPLEIDSTILYTVRFRDQATPPAAHLSVMGVLGSFDQNFAMSSLAHGYYKLMPAVNSLQRRRLQQSNHVNFFCGKNTSDEDHRELAVPEDGHTLSPWMLCRRRRMLKVEPTSLPR